METCERFESQQGNLDGCLANNYLRTELGGVDGAGGADIHAGGAVLAQSGIHHVVAVVLHRDRALGAFAFARAALDAFIINKVCHDRRSFQNMGEYQRRHEDSTIGQ